MKGTRYGFNFRYDDAGGGNDVGDVDDSGDVVLAVVVVVMITMMTMMAHNVDCGDVD